MSEEIIIAIIGAAGVICAAAIGLFKREKSRHTVVEQKIKGNNNTQIGIQIDQGTSRGHHER